uniref:autotransporter domain-containing protein n=1 Tax=Bosea sp. (in: a-proteobacteria) TaxID=1871050 RepID=UPI002FC6AC07
ELGLRLDAATSLFGLQTSAFGKLGWGYYARRDNQFGASLIGLPGSAFGFQGTRPDRNAALIATGLDVRLSTAVSLGARFDAELSQNNQSYAGSATLKVSF